jgi:hypothetical protein
MKHALLTLTITSLVATTAFADPIHNAARNGQLQRAALLIATGAEVNAKDEDGWTPLHYAAWRGKKEVAELLIANGADVNAKDVAGETPLHKAVIDGRKETAELLIAKGADVNAKTKDGWGEWWTVLDWAELVRKIHVPGYKESPKLIAARKEIPDLLRKHGGMTGAELALIPRLVQHGRFAFSFDAKKGKVYEVQDSFDLLNWEVIKTYTGTGVSVRFDEERDHDPPQWFYRVKMVE